MMTGAVRQLTTRTYNKTSNTEYFELDQQLSRINFFV